MNNTETPISVNVRYPIDRHGTMTGTVEVEGTVFEMPELPGFTFAAHMKPFPFMDDTGQNWRVAEVQSGMVFCYANSKEGLVKSARLRLERYGIVGCTKAINTAMEKYLDKKKKATDPKEDIP